MEKMWRQQHKNKEKRSEKNVRKTQFINVIILAHPFLRLCRFNIFPFLPSSYSSSTFLHYFFIRFLSDVVHSFFHAFFHSFVFRQFHSFLFLVDETKNFSINQKLLKTQMSHRNVFTWTWQFRFFFILSIYSLWGFCFLLHSE